VLFTSVGLVDVNLVEHQHRCNRSGLESSVMEKRLLQHAVANVSTPECALRDLQCHRYQRLLTQAFGEQR
jgi:hypothetical protein